MRSLCLTIARLTTAAWVGAAVLFVVTSVREVLSPFDSTTKDMLVATRFPAYYLFGITLTGLGWLATGLARRHPAVAPWRAAVAWGLLTLALGLVVLDYLIIFRPLAAAIQPPGQARPSWFESYHHASMGINTAQIACCLAAALLLCYPARSLSSGDQ